MSKLREKYSRIIVRTHFTPKEQSQQCEQITDDFAVKFADWFVENNHEKEVGNYVATELLQIFKEKYYE